MNYNENIQKNARAWLVEQVKADKTDSGLAQRFHVWLQQQSGGEISFPDSTIFFIGCCLDEHIHAATINDRSVYGIYPDGLPAQPEYKGADYGTR